MSYSRRIDYTQYSDFIHAHDYSDDLVKIGDKVCVIRDRRAPRRITPPSNWRHLLNKLGIVHIYPEHADYTGHCGWVVAKGYYPGENEAILVFEDNQTRKVYGFTVRDVERIE